MLANDGAVVYSVDLDGILQYSAGAVAGTIRVEETSVTAAEALSRADIVVGGVPSKAFQIPAEGIKAGAICINVAQHMNFGEGTEARCALVPAIGKVTIALLARNLLRLHANFHAPPAQEKVQKAKLTLKRPTLGCCATAMATAALVAVAAFYVGFQAGIASKG